jgi:purine-binding chemotaxis protein CheW
MQVAIVEINGREFAIPVSFLLTILKAGSIYKVPLSSPEKLGLINFQGEILTVFHPGMLIDNMKKEAENDNVVLILKMKTANESWKVGIFVDRVLDIFSVNSEDIFDLPEESSVNKELINKSIRRTGKNIWLLNIDKLLLTNELEQSNARIG